MPSQNTRTTFAARFGQKATISARQHAGDPVRYGRIDLPPGISNGIGRVIECYSATYEKDTNQKQADGSSAAGQLYVRMVASCVQPKTHTHDGAVIPTEGIQFSQIVPVCEKGVAYRGEVLDFDACIAAVSNELKKVMGPDFDTTDLDKAVSLVGKVKPYTRFSTTQTAADPNKINPRTGKPYEARTWENWLGSKGLENYAAENTPDPGKGVNVGTTPAPQTQPFNEFAGGNGGGDAVATGTEDEEDLDALAERADPPHSEDEAQERLDRIAEGLGIGDEAGAASSYADVVTLIREAREKADGGDSGEGETPEEQPEEVEAVKGAVYDLEVPKDVKNPKKGSKTVEVEVTKVDKAKKTCEAKDTSTKRPVTDAKGKPVQIPWASLGVK